MSSRLSPILLAILVLAAAPAQGENVAPDKAATCGACHGNNGVSPQPIYPHLAGQYANYLEHALREYRSGARKNVVMVQQAKELTDGEIEALAAYYAAMPGPLYTPSIPSR